MNKSKSKRGKKRGSKTKKRAKSGKDDCEEKEPHYGARVHAQGTDCGGRSGSTIGAPGINQATPVTVSQGLGLSNATWAMLNKTQKRVREDAKERADEYIRVSPEVGGRLEEKSFPASDRRGGKRYDVDTYGDGPSFTG